MAELRIAIDARLQSGQAGGVESVIVGLASGLSRIEENGRERYHFLTFAGSDQWLRPYVGGRSVILNVPQPPPSRIGAVRAYVRSHAPALRRAWRAAPVVPGMLPPPPRSDGTLERAGMDVVHFPVQGAFLTELPSIYHPHDLQHLHLPQFFSARERAIRESHYRAFCEQARVVVVTSRWMRDDVMRQYGLPEGKVSVIPWAPVVTEYPEPSERDLRNTRERLGIPDRFVLYSAQTWPHKNHLGLVEALAILRDSRGLRVPLVASGFRNNHHPEIERRARALGVEDQIHWVGFVTPLELQSLLRLATAVVIPSLFEAASGPLWDAFAAGVPAASSNVTSLPEQADGAAILFDPRDPAAIANAVFRLWSEPDLRAELVRRGRANVSRYSWDLTARMFRAQYRRVAGVRMTDEDRELLAAEPYL